MGSDNSSETHANTESSKATSELTVKEDATVNTITVHNDAKASFNGTLTTQGNIVVNGELNAKEIVKKAQAGEPVTVTVLVGNKLFSGKLILDKSQFDGIIFADPAWENDTQAPSSVVIKDLNDFNSQVVAGRKSYILLGSEDASIFNETKMTFGPGEDEIGAWAYVAAPLELKKGALVVNPALDKKPEQVESNSLTVAKNGLLILNAANATPDKALITVNKISVDGSVYLANMKPTKNRVLISAKEGKIDPLKISTSPLFVLKTDTTHGLSFTSEYSKKGLAVLNGLLLGEALATLPQQEAKTPDLMLLSRFSDAQQYGLSFKQATDLVNVTTTAAASTGVYNAQLDMGNALAKSLNAHDERGLWIDLLGAHTQAKTLYGNSGYKSNLYGAVFGANLEVNPETLLGVALVSGTTKAHTMGLATTLDNKTTMIGGSLLGKYRAGHVEIKGDLTFNAGTSKVTGTLMDVALDQKIKSQAWTLGTQVNYSYALNDRLTLRPHAGLRYTRLNVKGYATPFNTAKDSLNVVTLPVGVSLEGRMTHEDWTFTPKADLTVTPSLGNKKAKSTVQVLQKTYTFDTQVVDTAPVSIGLGVKATKKALTFGAHYTAELGNKGRQNHELRLSAVYAF